MEEATKWIGGLDRIHRARGILRCHDFTATPFVPSGKQSSEEALFDWIVSDFGLNDAIEAGLVKTPRVVVRDDGKLTSDYKSRLYHIYNDPEVKDDLNRKAEEQEPLPDLVLNGYYLLGKDWLETAQAWKKAGSPTPPVMITVGNRTETAARVKYSFDHGKIRIDELQSPPRTLHIDSKVLEKAESQIEAAELNGQGEEDHDEDDGRPGEEIDQGPAGGMVASDRGHGGQGGAARRADPERHLRGHALRGLGREDGDAHHGAAGLQQPVALRAGGRARVAADIVRR